MHSVTDKLSVSGARERCLDQQSRHGKQPSLHCKNLGARLCTRAEFAFPHIGFQPLKFHHALNVHLVSRRPEITEALPLLTPQLSSVPTDLTGTHR